MDKIENFHDIISDLPEGFKPISPEPEINDEDDTGPQDTDSPNDLSLHSINTPCDKYSPKRKVSEDAKMNMELDRNSNSSHELEPNTNLVDHSPPKIVRENIEATAFPCDFNGAFDFQQNSQMNTQTFSPLTTNMNPLNTISTQATSAVDDLNASVSNEAEDIVRKLCKNGKVMEFQEGEDFIKVIVYEDSEEDSDKENNPRYY